MKDRIREIIEDYEIDEIDMAIDEALKKEISPLKVLEAMVEGIKKVGDRFERKEIFIPDMVMSAETMKKGLKKILPLVDSANKEGADKIVIGSVEGDVHDIGKNIVTVMLQSRGFTVIDLGVDVSPEAFIEAVKKEKPKVVAASAYISSTVPQISRLGEELAKAGLRDKVKFLIGGCAVYPAHMEEYNADGYARDWVGTIKEVERLLGS